MRQDNKEATSPTSSETNDTGEPGQRPAPRHKTLEHLEALGLRLAGVRRSNDVVWITAIDEVT